MKNKNPIIKKNQKIYEAINRIKNSKIKILFVVDEGNKLLGSISSGDIRRSFARKISLNDNVQKIMFKKPKYRFKKKSIDISDDLICLPIVNKKKKIIDFQFSNVLKKEKKNTIFLMAGGKGIRLMPLTKNTPKPMLRIKGIPIIEKIILSFRSQGFRNFVISINYLGHMIKNYLGDGKKFNVNINYIKEKKFLGTAGSLSILDLKKSTFPIIVVNCDFISEIDYNNLILYHKKKKSDFTICTKNKVFQIPYGEIKQKNNRIKNIIEKPNINHLINIGIYTINETIIKNLKKNSNVMMNDLIKNQLKNNKRIYSYPIYENWVDVGDKENFYNNR